MDRVLEVMGKANVKAIVGTPTYGVLTWMLKEHPEILATEQRSKSLRIQTKPDKKAVQFYFNYSYSLRDLS
ncbi:MAG TPA: beta-galactosidase [Ruminiclostridium sp.]|nr:beta-galactosidase [Ruminiclostridium sp.]